ncbi:hypothetical protein EJB05_21891, partial [Eragrostis curvula]
MAVLVPRGSLIQTVTGRVQRAGSDFGDWPPSHRCFPAADTRCLFDKMPLSRKGKKDMKQHESRGLDELPDGVLEHILGLLPAEEAVRTCLLAQRWRHLWKSAASLRVVSADGQFLDSGAKLREFMDHLLLGRGGAALELFELTIGDEDELLRDEEYVLPFVESWFRHAVRSKVQVLRLLLLPNDFHVLDDMPLVSNHLTRLELCRVEVHGSFLNFSGCPNLEHLEFDACDLYFTSTKASFESLKCLSITGSNLCVYMDNSGARMRISAPNLVSLVLHRVLGATPIFENLPSLLEASVISDWSADGCKQDAKYWDCDCEYCDISPVNGSVKLRYIFKRDMRYCPTFGNLKNLWLNDYWCVPDNFCLLACILEHSPILEKLTLQLFSEGPEHKMELEGSISPTRKAATISKYLKTVVVKCEAVDVRIVKVLNFLCTCKKFWVAVDLLRLPVKNCKAQV